MGRPTKKTKAVVDEILERLACGESLRRICDDEGMPDRINVIRWLASDDEFRNQYAQAREMQADALFDEMLDIADDGANDFTEGKNGETVVDHEHVQRSRLRVDTRKFVVARLAPKKYGERQEIEHSGEIKGQVVLTMPSNGR